MSNLIILTINCISIIKITGADNQIDLNTTHVKL